MCRRPDLSVVSASGPAVYCALGISGALADVRKGRTAPMDMEKLTVDQLTKLAQAEKKQGARAKSDMVKVRKSAEELSKAAKAVAEISKKNPEL